MKAGRRSVRNRKSQGTAPPISRRTRQEHAHELAQDYAEMIAELIDTTGEARVIDIARRLGVTHVTVGKTIRRLQRAGLVTAQPYRAIFLTETGRHLAEESKRRHVIVLEFLKSLGIPDSVAQSDAEGIEHHVSPQTLAAFRRHLGKQIRNPKNEIRNKSEGPKFK